MQLPNFRKTLAEKYLLMKTKYLNFSTDSLYHLPHLTQNTRSPFWTQVSVMKYLECYKFTENIILPTAVLQSVIKTSLSFQLSD